MKREDRLAFEDFVQVSTTADGSFTPREAWSVRGTASGIPIWHNTYYVEPVQTIPTK